MNVLEGPARLSMDGITTRHLLPAPDRQIDIGRLDLHSNATPPGPFSSKQRGAWPY